MSRHQHYRPPAPDDPSFFDAPHSEPTTSKDAADTVRSGSAIIRGKVYERLAALPGGATEQELEFATGLHGNTIRPRLWELERAKRIVKTDEKRANLSGRLARVYKAL